jgi:hypothetical protein
MNESVKAVRTAAQALAQQKADHEKPKPPPTTAAIVPLEKPTPENISGGLDNLSEYTSTGTVLRFSKEGKFVRPTQGDEEVVEGTQLVCHWDLSRKGYQRFNGAGEPPDARIALVFGGVPPKRGELGDEDPAQWPVSKLTGQPEDPWRPVMMVPLENPATGELLVFSTMSRTGLRAVANLLTQSARMMARDPNHLPVVKLRCGGYSDKRFGWIKIPAFEFVGNAPRTNIAAADTSVEATLNDRIPF